MKNKKTKLAIILWSMFFVVMLTASPLIILANRIEPIVFGMPFFLFWCSFTPFVLWMLMLAYSKIINQLEEEQERNL